MNRKYYLSIIIILIVVTIGAYLYNQQTNNIQQSVSNDLQEISQLTVDLDLLQGYYHPDVLGRKPLIILKNRFFEGDNVSLTKFDMPVLFLSENEILEQKINAYFEFTDITIKENTAIVKFEYLIEGVIGELEFRKNDKGWEIIRRYAAEK